MGSNPTQVIRYCIFQVGIHGITSLEILSITCVKCTFFPKKLKFKWSHSPYLCCHTLRISYKIQQQTALVKTYHFGNIFFIFIPSSWTFRFPYNSVLIYYSFMRTSAGLCCDFSYNDFCIILRVFILKMYMFELAYKDISRTIR